MGLTASSVGRAVTAGDFDVKKLGKHEHLIALMGNPNVGKSTLFNALTGLKQHTGNWPGKTVSVAQGRCDYKGETYIFVDLPGTYSLLTCSEEERVAAEFLRADLAQCVVVVCDATCLMRNLNLVLQVTELCKHTLVCVNLMDEARRKKIDLDLPALERRLGVPVVGISAGSREGLSQFLERLRNVVDGYERPLRSRKCFGVAQALAPDAPQELTDRIAQEICSHAEGLASDTVVHREEAHGRRQIRIEKIFVSKWTGVPILLTLLMLIFFLTIRGANLPSMLLERLFGHFGDILWKFAEWLHLPWFFAEPLIDGIYMTTAKVVSVMLPPIAIFFPLFTLLEDVGYLPRLAFLTDHAFSRCGACGKQALTTCMGFGCNAAGVVGCRIIDSPRERLLALLTNSFIPCNGRFPGLIVLGTMALGVFDNSFYSALLVTMCIIFAVFMSMAASWVLNKTLLRGEPSSFTLELPPFRKPNIGQIFVRSVFDRTIFVLGRAAAVAAPAGLLLWLLQNIQIGGLGLLQHAAALLEPIGAFLGMNGAILLAFILAFPANELVLPICLTVLGVSELTQAGWGSQTILCMMVFFLFHWPCSTTMLTIWKETRSAKWTALAFILPTLVGTLCCIVLRLLI